jgi:hypothetical protein
MVTSCVDRIPIAAAAPDERSSATPGVKGPRSFTRTTTLRPVLGLPITRQVPKGSDLCAAVIPSGLNASPDAVRCPRSSSPYHVARTTWAKAGVAKKVRINVIDAMRFHRDLLRLSGGGLAGPDEDSVGLALQRSAKLRKKKTESWHGNDH